MALLRKLLPWLFVILIWDASPTDGVTGYKIYYTDHTDSFIVDVIALDSANSSLFILSINSLALELPVSI